MMNDKYAMQIFRSEDEGFVALCQEFPSLSAFGEIREEAIAKLKSLWI